MLTSYTNISLDHVSIIATHRMLGPRYTEYHSQTSGHHLENSLEALKHVCLISVCHTPKSSPYCSPTAPFQRVPTLDELARGNVPWPQGLTDRQKRSAGPPSRNSELFPASLMSSCLELSTGTKSTSSPLLLVLTR